MPIETNSCSICTFIVKKEATSIISTFRITDPSLTVRRMCIAANHITREKDIIDTEEEAVQLDFFTDIEKAEREKAAEKERLRREKAMQLSILEIKKKYGKNAVLRGMNFEDGATARQRNEQVGGHKA